MAAADATSITPWRSREEHRPLGEIQRVRQEVYRRSAIERTASADKSGANRPAARNCSAEPPRPELASRGKRAEAERHASGARTL